MVERWAGTHSLTHIHAHTFTHTLIHLAEWQVGKQTQVWTCILSHIWSPSDLWFAFSAPRREVACRRSGSAHANLCLVQHFVEKSGRVYVAGELYCPKEKQVQLVSSDMLISLYANWFPAIMDDRCRNLRFIVVAFLHNSTDIPAVCYETRFQHRAPFPSSSCRALLCPGGRLQRLHLLLFSGNCDGVQHHGKGKHRLDSPSIVWNLIRGDFLFILGGSGSVWGNQQDVGVSNNRKEASWSCKVAECFGIEKQDMIQDLK